MGNMVEQLSSVISSVNAFVWGVPMIVAIVGVGVTLSGALLFMPIRKIGHAFGLLWSGRTPQGVGDISGFSALMVSLSATVGTGNIAGVATAIALGGPGALFWMWITALFGMATKYAEAVCAVHFRETDSSGKYIGGPMYYIKNGLGKKWQWLAFLFALFGAIAAFGIGNMVQSNSIAHGLQTTLGVDPLLSGVILVVLVGMVLLGGITRIATWAASIVPFMVIAYVGTGLVVLAFNYSEIPAAITLIVTTAFTGTAAAGGFAGAAVWAAIRFGVARGIFSNEAGLGSAPIAHAAAQTNSPVRQGHIAMLGTFIDTLIICSITGLIIVTSGLWVEGTTGAALTSAAFASAITGGNYIVVIALSVFAFTTILGWSYYGERCWQYLFGIKGIMFYRVLWLIAVFVGPAALAVGDGVKESIDLIWLLADTMNAMMALPNLIALMLLMPVVLKLTKAYYADQ